MQRLSVPQRVLIKPLSHAIGLHWSLDFCAHYIGALRKYIKHYFFRFYNGKSYLVPLNFPTLFPFQFLHSISLSIDLVQDFVAFAAGSRTVSGMKTAKLIEISKAITREHAQLSRKLKTCLSRLFFWLTTFGYHRLLPKSGNFISKHFPYKTLGLRTEVQYRINQNSSIAYICNFRV